MKMKFWNTRKKQMEKEKKTNWFTEFLKVVQHFFPTLNQKLKETEDPRHKSYIIYSNNILLLSRIIAYVCGIESMNEFTEKFKKEEVIENINIVANQKLDSMPHGDTVNDYLKELNPAEIEKVITCMNKRLIEMRCFDEYRLLGKYYKIAFDGSGIFTFDERHCDKCLTKTFFKGTDKEYTKYFHYVLEAKLIVGSMAISIATEFIENPEDIKAFNKKILDEFEGKDISKIEFKKQDCELNAFYRLIEKVRKAYPRLPICALLDSEYACAPVFKICKENNIEYIVRFKEGSIPTLARDFNDLKDYAGNITVNEIGGVYKFVNDIDYNEYKVNIVEYTDPSPDRKYPFRLSDVA